MRGGAIMKSTASRGVTLKLGENVRFAGQGVPRGAVPPAAFTSADALPHLEQAAAAGNAVAFERGRHGKTDGFVRALLVRHDEMGVERVQSALAALHGGVERFEVDGDIGSFFHSGGLLSGGLTGGCCNSYRTFVPF